ncbi:MAG TPA: hypothetical protein VI455_03450 [Terriglobia bacterium]
MVRKVCFGASLAVALLAPTVMALLLAPAVMLGQQQNKQNGQSRLQKNQQTNEPTDQVAPATAPLMTNPEGLLPVLPMGPLPRSNGSPNYTNQYLNQTINQKIYQQLFQFVNMAEPQAGGNTSNPNANQLSNGGLNGVAQANTRGAKNARGLSTQQSNQPNNQHGTGQHANPGQGQGQSP